MISSSSCTLGLSSLSVGSNGSRENNNLGLMLVRQTGPMMRDDQELSNDNIVGEASSHGRSSPLGAGASGVACSGGAFFRTSTEIKDEIPTR